MTANWMAAYATNDGLAALALGNGRAVTIDYYSTYESSATFSVSGTGTTYAGNLNHFKANTVQLSSARTVDHLHGLEIATQAIANIGFYSPLAIRGDATTSNNHGSFHRMNFQFGSETMSFATGDGVIGIANATTIPSTTPGGGGVLYSDAGIPFWKASNGTAYNLTAGTGAPTTAPYLTFGLDGGLSAEFSIRESDESTLTSGQDIHFKWSEAAATRNFIIENIGAAGDVALSMRTALGTGKAIEYLVTGDANPKMTLTYNALSWGAGGASTVDTNLYRSAANLLKTDDTFEAPTLRISGNSQLGSFTESYGGGTGVIGIRNATTAPTTDPTSGGVLYVELGSLKWRSSSGVVTTLAA
jgi:hypothetical protein